MPLYEPHLHYGFLHYGQLTDSPSMRILSCRFQESCEGQQIVTSGLAADRTSPISTAGTPASCSARVSGPASSAESAISRPPAVCGSKRSVRMSAGTD